MEESGYPPEVPQVWELREKGRGRRRIKKSKKG